VMASRQRRPDQLVKYKDGIPASGHPSWKSPSCCRKWR